LAQKGGQKMSEKMFLVSGATGSIGTKMVRHLLDRGHKTRAMVHKIDQRSEDLRRLGADVIECNFLDIRSLRRAFKDVKGAYFGYPVAPAIIEATVVFAQAAKEANTEIIVNISQVSARDDALSDATISHWMSERVFDWSKVKTTHIRPTFFFDWFLYFAKGAQTGLIQMPFGNHKLSFVSAKDVAHAAVAILENPSGHQGKTYNLYGPEQYSFEEAYQLIAQTLNHKIKYEKIRLDAWVDALRNSLPPQVVQHFENGPVGDMPSGIFKGPVDTLEMLLGRKPITVAEFAREHRDVISVPNSDLKSASGYSVE
jgi:NAD(P)H dehydrogenase (quinone)